MSFRINLAKKAHKKIVKYLQKNNSYDDKIITRKNSNPIFILHIGASINSGGMMHLEHWITQFKESGHEFLVVTRQIELFNEISKKNPSTNVSLITKVKQIDQLFEHYKTIKAVFYPANTANNMHFLRTYGKKHIFLGHGDSDKSSSMNRLFKMYDEIYVSGDAHIDRFNLADFDTTGLKFKIIGRPAKKINTSSEKKEISKIIYIPTWEGFVSEQNYTSAPISINILKNIRNCTNLPIEIKLHPLTGLVDSNNKDLELKIKNLKISNLKIHNRKKNLDEILKDNVIYICDISSVISECLTTGCPIMVYNPNKETRSYSSETKITDFTYTFKSANELKERVIEVLKNDYKKEIRKSALNYFINIDATLNSAFKNELDLIEKIQ